MARRRKEESKQQGVNDALLNLGFMPLSSEYTPVRVRRCLSTGLPALDVILARDNNGVFGLPFGRQFEVSGKPDSGKTSLLFEIAASAQRHEHSVTWSESELEIDEERARQIGCNPDMMMLDFPPYLEISLTNMRKAIELLPEFDSPEYTGSRGMVSLYDSVGAICTKSEYIVKEKGGEEEESAQPGVFAKKMAMWQRRFKKMLVRRDAIVVYANHLIEKINTFGHGRKTQTRGGNALRYHCNVRLETVYTGKLLDSKGKPIGIKTKIEVIKAKNSNPFAKVEGMNFIFGQGYDKDQSLMMALEMRKLAKKDGLKYLVEGLGDALTLEAFRKQLREQEGMREALMQAIYES